MGKLDPKTFIKKLDLDVTTNKEKTKIIQEDKKKISDDSPNHYNIVSKSFNICEKRPREKTNNSKSSTQYLSLKFIVLT